VQTENKSLYKILFFVFSGILVSICLVFGFILFHSYQRYQTFKQGERRLQNELFAAQESFQKREAYLSRLLSDPAFFEHVVRQRLGYSEKDEVIFRFDNRSTEAL